MSVSYPNIQVSLQDAEAVFKQGTVAERPGRGRRPAGQGEHYTSTCPGSLISLFGYSEGAWIINVWEQQYPDEASHIRNAGLIGDPCYGDIRGDAGLARLFTSSCGFAPGAYILGETNITPTKSVCLTADPVCGVPYLAKQSLAGFDAQVAATAACAEKLPCTHFNYHPSEDADMAAWMLTDTT